jgi:rsbT co-antagonist protein RsbR
MATQQDELKAQIAELKNALRDSEARNRALLNAIPDMVFVLDQNGVFIDYKAEKDSSLAVPPEFFLGKNIADVLPPTIAEEALHHAQRAFETNSIQEYQYDLTPMDEDEPHNYETRASIINEDQVVFLVRDITERRQITQSLEQNIELVTRLKSLIDNTNDFISTSDLEGNVIYTNPPGLEMLGMPLDTDLTTARISDYHPDEWTQKIGEEYLPIVVEKGVWAGELEMQRVDGSRFPISGVIMLVQDEAGETLGFGAIYRDITAQKAAEDTLKEREERYRAIINQAADALFITGKDGKFIDVSARTIESLGYTYDEIIGTACWDMDKKWTPERYAEYYDRASVGTPILVDGQQTRKDGSTFPVELRTVAIEIDGEKVIVAFARDVTDRQNAEAERQRLQQEIIEAQQQALREISTPVIPIMQDIIVMPLIGSIDSTRARDITRTLLAAITEHHAKAVILDITGVPVVDSGVADHLNKSIQAARLKGAKTIITGISDAVAETIVDLGIDWGSIATLRDLQTGLTAALRDLGTRLG